MSVCACLLTFQFDRPDPDCVARVQVFVTTLCCLFTSSPTTGYIFAHLSAHFLVIITKTSIICLFY